MSRWRIHAGYGQILYEGRVECPTNRGSVTPCLGNVAYFASKVSPNMVHQVSNSAFHRFLKLLCDRKQHFLKIVAANSFDNYYG
jgi:hypothetical protein